MDLKRTLWEISWMIKDTSDFIYFKYFKGIYYAIAWIKISQKVNRRSKKKKERQLE